MIKPGLELHFPDPEAISVWKNQSQRSCDGSRRVCPGALGKGVGSVTSVGPYAPVLSLSIHPLWGDVLSLVVIFRTVFFQPQLETEVGNRLVAFFVFC